RGRHPHQPSQTHVLLVSRRSARGRRSAVLRASYKALLPNTSGWDQPTDTYHHRISHDAVPTNQSGGATSTQQAAVDKMSTIATWHAEQIAYLANALAAFDDGDGKTVLDNTAILWVSEISEGPSHKFDDMPFVLFGDCGGALQTGRFAFNNDETHNTSSSRSAKRWGSKATTCSATRSSATPPSRPCSPDGRRVLGGGAVAPCEWGG
ncbi:MAG: hypothetical protein RIF41_08845, partial [Polyangiaceae bacterium]